MTRLLACLLLFTSLPSQAYELHRKVNARELAVDLQRSQLANGLTVLLSPDNSVSSVMVEMTFRAGAVFEPPGKSGMAHLIEHLMASGPTPDTAYDGLLERRGARYFNASTEFETMAFQVVMPAEELPLALWVTADRLGSIPPLLSDDDVERNRLVVLQERNLRDVDAPYGLSMEKMFATLFAAPHPLHGSVIGTVEELQSVSAQDVRDFVAKYLVPANAILTVVGRFDVAQAKALIEQNFSRLAPGERAQLPRVAPFDVTRTVTAQEVVARSPAAIEAWRFPVPAAQGDTLKLGAQLFSFMLDGAFGMRLGADFQQNEGESMFMVELVVPWNDPPQALAGDLEGFIRFMTMKQVPPDLLQSANLALDRFALFDLETLEGRSRRLTELERLQPGVSVAADCAQHWLLDPSQLRGLAQGFLQAPHVLLHARPTRPRPDRPERRIR